MANIHPMIELTDTFNDETTAVRLADVVPALARWHIGTADERVEFAAALAAGDDRVAAQLAAQLGIGYDRLPAARD